MSKYWSRVGLVILFAIFFGLLEAIVVIYLRDLFGSGNTLISPKITPSDVLFSLGFIAFLNPSASFFITGSSRLLSLELLREFSTIVMIVTLAFIAGKTIKEKLSYFLLVFGIWDIFYYIFLKILINWPTSFLEPDVLFLIPVAWISPIITPVVISIILTLIAILILTEK